MLEPGVHEHETGETGGRVRQAVADGLWSRIHHRHVSETPAVTERLQSVNRRALFISDPGRQRPAAKRRTDLVRYRRRQVRVDAEQS